MTVQVFNQLLDENNSFLFSLAQKFTKDQSRAKDLYQDTLLLAFRNKDQFLVGTNFRGWTRTIMRNAFIKKYSHSSKKYDVKSIDESFIAQYEIQHSTPNGAESNIKLNEIDRIINSIDPKYSGPFKMYYEGYKYDEISESFKIPVGTIKSRIFTARSQIKEAYTRLHQ